MRTFRQIQSRIHAAALHAGPQWLLCVFLGAYVALQIAAPAAIVG